MSLNKPSLLFVDEPTTGLDSNAAFLVMNCLRQLSLAYRMTIIAIYLFLASITSMYSDWRSTFCE